MVKRGGGTSDEAKMIYHEVIVQFVKTVFSRSEFTLESDLSAYLIGVARFVWFKELNSKNKNNFEPLEHHELTLYSNSNIEFDIIGNEKLEMLEFILSKLGSKCKEVLMYWSHGYSMQEISLLLGYKSEGMVRKKKFLCIAELSSYIRSHPHLLETLGS